jgi:hypothetical protein
LKSERFDLENAARVLDKLSGSTTLETGNSDDPDSGPRSGKDGDPSQPKVTIGEMALSVLSEAGPAGLTSNDVLEKIREKWLPALMRTSLSPPLSRLKERGDITLENDKWRLTNAL